MITVVLWLKESTAFDCSNTRIIGSASTKSMGHDFSLPVVSWISSRLTVSWFPAPRNHSKCLQVSWFWKLILIYDRREGLIFRSWKIWRTMKFGVQSKRYITPYNMLWTHKQAAEVLLYPCCEHTNGQQRYCCTLAVNTRMGSRGVAVPLRILGTKSVWVVNATLWLLSSRERDPVPTIQEAGWALWPVWKGVDNLVSTGVQTPDYPACSKFLYWLCYLDCWCIE
jgi:hypothetical protein